MNKLQVGQVLWLKVRYQIDIVSTIKHPMIIAKIEDNYIEVIAFDKTSNKLHQLFHNYNLYINSDNPKETVIKEDSYAQLNTKLMIERNNYLLNARFTEDKLSNEKLEQLLFEYNNYQEKYGVLEQRIVYMTKKEILELNPDIKN